VAILIETEESLAPTEAASAVEDGEYARSWMS
jgi:homogentisate 1,2-dioxygenase